MSSRHALASANRLRRPHTNAATGIAFALLATIVWSFNFVAGRGLADAMPPCTLALCRWLVAFLAVLPFAWRSVQKEWRHFLEYRFYYFMAGLIGIAYFNTAIYMGAHTVSAVNMSLIASCSPLFTMVMARFIFGERITYRRVCGIIAALAGIILLISRGNPGVLASLHFQQGDLLLLSAAFSFACYTLLLRKKPEGSSLSANFAVTFGIGIVLLLPFSLWELAQNDTHVRFSFALAGGILYMGLGASLLAFWCWAKAINAIGPSRASVIYYSLPLFSGLEAVLLLGESISWYHYAGGIFILGGLVLATREPS